jgi:hypothetical protein
MHPRLIHPSSLPKKPRLAYETRIPNAPAVVGYLIVPAVVQTPCYGMLVLAHLFSSSLFDLSDARSSHAVSHSSSSGTDMGQIQCDSISVWPSREGLSVSTTINAYIFANAFDMAPSEPLKTRLLQEQTTQAGPKVSFVEDAARKGHGSFGLSACTGRMRPVPNTNGHAESTRPYWDWPI